MNSSKSLYYGFLIEAIYIPKLYFSWGNWNSRKTLTEAGTENGKGNLQK